MIDLQKMKSLLQNLILQQALFLQFGDIREIQLTKIGIIDLI